MGKHMSTAQGNLVRQCLSRILSEKPRITSTKTLRKLLRKAPELQGFKNLLSANSVGAHLRKVRMGVVVKPVPDPTQKWEGGYDSPRRAKLYIEKGVFTVLDEVLKAEQGSTLVRELQSIVRDKTGVVVPQNTMYTFKARFRTTGTTEGRVFGGVKKTPTVSKPSPKGQGNKDAIGRQQLYSDDRVYDVADEELRSNDNLRPSILSELIRRRTGIIIPTGSLVNFRKRFLISGSTKPFFSAERSNAVSERYKQKGVFTTLDGLLKSDVNTPYNTLTQLVWEQTNVKLPFNSLNHFVYRFKNFGTSAPTKASNKATKERKVDREPQANEIDKKVTTAKDVNEVPAGTPRDQSKSESAVITPTQEQIIEAIASMSGELKRVRQENTELLSAIQDLTKGKAELAIKVELLSRENARMHESERRRLAQKVSLELIEGQPEASLTGKRALY